MSTITNVEQTTNKLVTNYDVEKFLLGFNDFGSGNVAASGADVDLVIGMVLGRISATQKIVPLDKDATDGSQLAVGLALVTETIADGSNKDIQFVNKGRVAESFINFADVETLDTPTGPTNNQKTIRDQLEALGLILETGLELTAVDNQ